MPSTNVWTCNTKQELADFHKGVYEGTIYQTHMFVFKGPPHTLALFGSLAHQVGPFFEWFAEHRAAGLLGFFSGIGRAVVLEGGSPYRLVADVIAKAATGNRERLDAARRHISDDELLALVLAIFDHNYVFSRVQKPDGQFPYAITFYQDN